MHSASFSRIYFIIGTQTERANTEIRLHSLNAKERYSEIDNFKTFLGLYILL